MTARILHSEELALRWSEFSPMIALALKHGNGDITPHNLFMECMSGQSQCWIIEEEDELYVVAITRLVRYVTYSEIQVVTTTGRGWFQYGVGALTQIENFGREMGCKYTTINGRKGWARALPEEYKTPYQIYMREL